jgi:hypothetical protein
MTHQGQRLHHHHTQNRNFLFKCACWSYHYGMARHHLVKAQTYREHAKMRYGLQLPLFREDEGTL